MTTPTLPHLRQSFREMAGFVRQYRQAGPAFRKSELAGLAILRAYRCQWRAAFRFQRNHKLN